MKSPKSNTFSPAAPEVLGRVARRIVEEAHLKSGSEGDSRSDLPDTPIGRGGKVDDTSVVVAEVVEWTQAHRAIWAQVRRDRQWHSLLTCGGMHCVGDHNPCCEESDEEEE